MSASQRKRRGGAVNSRQARKRNRLVASTARRASEAEPIELEESGVMRSPPVIDELCKKGAQVLLSHLKAASDELGVTAAAAPDDGRVSLGAPKFEEDNSKFIISRAPSLKGEAVLAVEEVVDLTRESSEPMVIDLTHDDSVVIVEAVEEVVDLTRESSEPVVIDLTHDDSVVIVEGVMRSPPVIDELCKKGAQVLLSHLKAASDELGVTAAAPPDDGRAGGVQQNCMRSSAAVRPALRLAGDSGAVEEVVDLTRESSEPVVIDLTHDDSVVIVEENEWQRGNLRQRGQRQSDICVLISDDEDETRDNDAPSGTVSCPICMDGYSEIVQSGRLIVSTKCGHVFCSQCLHNSLRNANSCPACRKKLTHRECHPIYI